MPENVLNVLGVCAACRKYPKQNAYAQEQLEKAMEKHYLQGYSQSYDRHGLFWQKQLLFQQLLWLSLLCLLETLPIAQQMKLAIEKLFASSRRQILHVEMAQFHMLGALVGTNADHTSTWIKVTAVTLSVSGLGLWLHAVKLCCSMNFLSGHFGMMTSSNSKIDRTQRTINTRTQAASTKLRPHSEKPEGPNIPIASQACRSKFFWVWQKMLSRIANIVDDELVAILSVPRVCSKHLGGSQS